MIRIEDFQLDTFRDLKRGRMFIGNDPHYVKKRMVAIFINMEDGTVRIKFVDSLAGEEKYVDLRALLRGFDCQEYVWC